MKKTESIRINADDKRYIKEQAAENRRTIQGQLEYIVDQYRKKKDSKKCS